MIARREAEPVFRGPPSALACRTVVALKLGISAATLYGFLQDKERLEDAFKKRAADSSRETGSKHVLRLGHPGRKATFPKTEIKLAAEIRSIRAQQLPYRVYKVLKRYRKLAEVEAIEAPPAGEKAGSLYERYVKSAFGQRLLSNFLSRNSLSRRKPSCVKTLTLATIIRNSRGFHRALEAVLVDEENRAKFELDPVFGRYILPLRINEDEVPAFFGSKMMMVNDTSEKATHVTMPAGFEDRFATIKVAVSADGFLLAVHIIFFGTGKKVEKYVDSDKVVVTFQKKAWIDGPGQKEWFKRVLKPYLRDVKAKLSLDPATEALLVNDNVKPHHYWEARRYAYEQLCTLNMNTPPNLTIAIQAIDDQIGNLVRRDAEEIINDAIDEDPQKKWMPKEKRCLFVKAYTTVVANWRSSESRRALIRGSVTRTGLAMEVSGRVPAERTKDGLDPDKLVYSLNPGLRPVRFPADYPRSLADLQHPSANDFTPFTPFTPRGTVAYVPGADAPPSPSLQPAQMVPLANNDDYVEFDSEEESEEGIDFGPQYREEEHEDYVEIGADDEEDCVLQALNNASVYRGCLDGCSCEREGKVHRCICSKFGHCLDTCACTNCQHPVAKGPVVLQAPAMTIEDAIRLNEGETVVNSIASHDEEDEALYFVVHWNNGSITEEPLENLVSFDDDWAINAALVEYADEAKLNLDPYIVVLKAIFGGKAGENMAENLADDRDFDAGGVEVMDDSD